MLSFIDEFSEAFKSGNIDGVADNHSFGAAAENEWSPRVIRVLIIIGML